MPSYDYRCEQCGKAFEIRASISEYSAGLTVRCPECGCDKTERSFSAVSVLTASRSNTARAKTCGGSCPPNCSC